MPTLGQYTLAELKAAIDTAITDKTLPDSITPSIDGSLRKDIVEDLFLKIQASQGGGTPAGSDTQIQYNNAGAFGADSGFTRDVAGGSTTILNTTDFGGGETIDGGITTTGGITTIEQIYSASAVPLFGARLQIDGTENAVNLTTANNTSGETNGFYAKGGMTVVGNSFGGNGTKITIDDGNEQITIGNIKAYDDDAAAGTAGLIAGMVYMTTGSGAAPLNVAGILMIKQ